ncbi:hypothetical protein HO173_011565 [Letharia columbiana]|uniref:Uncharacterized protein n=1 Tax=Letharia columbiana TaxID=112416 RepID=A0A8H6FJ72_9LECA|nr:uncharacterized protein HO173_011565 [Letharia columbiana]KAF6229525.1 hypothetical protein HO173_011565 [Letharia columbiana]
MAQLHYYFQIAEAGILSNPNLEFDLVFFGNLRLFAISHVSRYQHPVARAVSRLALILPDNSAAWYDWRAMAKATAAAATGGMEDRRHVTPGPLTSAAAAKVFGLHFAAYAASAKSTECDTLNMARNAATAAF